MHEKLKEKEEKNQSLKHEKNILIEEVGKLTEEITKRKIDFSSKPTQYSSS